MKISKRRLQQIIKEEMSDFNGELDTELETREDAFSGGDNLVLPIDHSKATKGPAVQAEPEMLPPAEPVLNNESVRRIRVYRGSNDLGKVCVLPALVYEHYYDAYVSGNTERALGILEEHLDTRIPGWIDYEW